MIHKFRFDPKCHAMFKAQCWGVDPYSPGKRCRSQLASMLRAGLNQEQLRFAVTNDGAALVTGLPVDEVLPPSPPKGLRPTDKKTVISECLLNGMSSLLGLHPVAFHNEKAGDLIHQIVPQPGSEASPSNAGADEFNLHTEATHMETPPNVLALVCVRNTEMGETNFVCLTKAMRDAPKWVTDELCQPNFTQSMGVSSGGWGQRYRLALLNGTADEPIYRLDFTDVEPVTVAAGLALVWLKTQAQANEVRVALQPGDMILINNHRSLHGRVGFTPDYSRGEQRWLQRQYMTADPLAGIAFDDRYPHVWLG